MTARKRAASRARTAAEATGFGGFAPGLLRFLRDLERNNDKAWFEAHRDEYETLYLEPARQFVAAMGPGLARISRGLHAEPRVNGAIMRIHRDTRFSKDKTPYKTGLFLRFHEGDPKDKAAPAFGLHLHATGLGMMAGSFGLDDARLTAYREAVLDARRGGALVEAVGRLEQAGYGLCEPHYKRIPRGFDAEHPRADWLRFRALYVHLDQEPVPSPMLGPGAVDFCLDHFRAMHPLQKWLVGLG